jgi:GGDEF domain-containing protein
MSDGLPVTFSVGVVSFPTPPSSVDEMLKTVDGLMYDVKRKGKDGAKFEVWTKENAVSADSVNPL